MSKIGDAPIILPSTVNVEKNGQEIMVNGPKGELRLSIDPSISLENEAGKLVFKRKNEQKKVKALHGLTRSLLANMIKGVTEGWSKDLELVGVGFRAQSAGNKLTLNVGYSHTVEIVAPDGINFEVLENTKIKISGIDKQLVGQIAANVKKVRPPDVYKGKGIRYAGEYIRKKLGKAGKVGTGAVGGK